MADGGRTLGGDVGVMRDEMEVGRDFPVAAVKTCA
jgi:hypothetical protein